MTDPILCADCDGDDVDIVAVPDSDVIVVACNYCGLVDGR